MTSYLFNRLYIDSWYSDFTIDVNGKIYKLHKMFIQDKSEFFKCLITNEEKMDTKKPIIINGVGGEKVSDSKIFNTFSWFYDDDLKNLLFGLDDKDISISTSLHDLLEYYYISDFLQINIIKNRCIQLMDLLLKSYHEYYDSGKNIYDSILLENTGNFNYRFKKNKGEYFDIDNTDAYKKTIEEILKVLFNEKNDPYYQYHKIFFKSSNYNYNIIFSNIIDEFIKTKNFNNLNEQLLNITGSANRRLIIGSIKLYLDDFNYKKYKHIPIHDNTIYMDDIENIWEHTNEKYKYILIIMLDINDIFDDEKTLISNKARKIEIFCS